MMKKEAIPMAKQNLSIPINPDLGHQVQAACNDLPLDSNSIAHLSSGKDTHKEAITLWK